MKSYVWESMCIEGGMGQDYCACKITKQRINSLLFIRVESFDNDNEYYNVTFLKKEKK